LAERPPFLNDFLPVPAEAVVIKGKIEPVYEASLVVGLTASVEHVLKSEPAAYAISSKPSIAEASVIVTLRLWKDGGVKICAIGDRRSL
jgi:hypothetical protein